METVHPPCLAPRGTPAGVPGTPVLIWLAGHVDEPVLGRRCHGALRIPGLGRVPEINVLRTQTVALRPGSEL